MIFFFRYNTLVDYKLNKVILKITQKSVKSVQFSVID